MDEQTGLLLIYGDDELQGAEADLRFGWNPSFFELERVGSASMGRIQLRFGRSGTIAAFPRLQEGRYTVIIGFYQDNEYLGREEQVTVTAGQVTELDLRGEPPHVPTTDAL
jgi:hypothetical protein